MLQNIKTRCGPKVVRLEIRASRNEVGPSLGQLVSGRMRPGHWRLGHAVGWGSHSLDDNRFASPILKAAQYCRTPKRRRGCTPAFVACILGVRRYCAAFL